MQERLALNEENNRDGNGNRMQESGSREVPISQKKRWDDLCMNDMISPYMSNEMKVPSIMNTSETKSLANGIAKMRC